MNSRQNIIFYLFIFWGCYRKGGWGEDTVLVGGGGEDGREGIDSKNRMFGMFCDDLGGKEKELRRRGWEGSDGFRGVEIEEWMDM